MNVEEVRRLGRLLQTKADEIRTLVSQIEGAVHSTTWEGPDARTFKNQWWPEHRSHLNQVANQVHGFGQSALNNAAEQEGVSGR
jgi:hypothetical protein